jgi:hypothetical protein
VNEDLQLVGEPNVVKSAIEAARESTKEQLRDYYFQRFFIFFISVL